MDGWLNAQIHHHGTSYIGGAYGAPPSEPSWYEDYDLCLHCYRDPCICPPVDADYESDYLAWWDEQVAAGRIVAPEDDEVVAHG